MFKNVFNEFRATQQELSEKLKGNQHKLDMDKDGDIDSTDFKHMRKKKKKKDDEGEIEMNSKLSNTPSNEQKESRIRSALKSVFEKKDNHNPNKDKAEKPEDALKGQGAKDMVNQPKEINNDDEKGHEDASKVGRVTKPAKARNAGDQVRSGDQKVVNAIAAAYKAMKNG